MRFTIVLLFLVANSALSQNRVVDYIQYRFVDASVPPQYHRSFTITATPISWQYTVDSYGEIISDSTMEMTQKWWLEIVEAQKKSKLRKGKEKNKRSCTGGTQVLIRIKSGDIFLKALNEYRCGGKNTGNLRGNPDLLKRALLKQ